MANTPTDWRDRLLKDLDDSLPETDLYERYYAGQHNLRFATEKFREAFGGLFREFSDNWCEVVVDACVERLEIQGFRFAATQPSPLEDTQTPPASSGMPTAMPSMPTGPGVQAMPATGAPDASTTGAEEAGDATAGTQSGDREAWRIWQANNLDCGSEIAHTQALVARRSYLIVGPQPDGSTDTPLITVEHPSQVIVRRSAVNRLERLAALKRWWDEETGRLMATVYLPDAIWRYQSAGTYKKADEALVATIRWQPRGDSIGEQMDNPLGVVPVVPLINRESLLGDGDSELSQVVPMQDLLNKYVTDMTVASEFQAFRQRVLMGVEVLRYPEDHPNPSLRGQPLPQQDLIASASRLWFLEDANAKVQELDAGDLKNYVDAITMVRNHIAARTRTPPHYLLGEIVNASGDALKAAEAGLVSKVRRRMRFFGESWEETMRLAFKLQGDDTRANDLSAETIWRNPETTTEAQLMDALGKLAALGVPQQVLWERAGFSPTEIDRMVKMLAAQPAPAPQPLAALIRAAATEGL